MAGDNPLSDIRGARMAGERWRSILTRTGNFKDPVDNHPEYPADIVCKAVGDAWREIQRRQELAPASSK